MSTNALTDDNLASRGRHGAANERALRPAAAPPSDFCLTRLEACLVYGTIIGGSAAVGSLVLFLMSRPWGP